MAQPEDFLDSVALEGTPGQAYASHKARAGGIVRYFASTRPLDFRGKAADENNTVTLMAHLHAAASDKDFTPNGQPVPSAQLAPQILLSMNKGEGKVGTGGEYDFALKGLAVIAYRYGNLLGPDGISHILNQLVPDDLWGGHDEDVEGYNILGFDIPETENHLLMIESSRYLFNQLSHDSQADERYDNNENGLTAWLLNFMQKSAMHDFMEFSARPYARFTLHSLLNLYEFARDPSIRTAAQILLDYTMGKCALSSSRQRRVTPYRRHQEQINHQNNPRNDLITDSGDQVSHFLLAYTGATDPQGTPARFPSAATFCGVIAATSSYRPPPAAYILAMQADVPPSLHTFHHGLRPRLTDRCSENAEGGIEIYFRSPSFLMSAGGNFLNSGYGKDEIGRPIKNKWEQASRAQAATLIPTRADVRFADLIRFESWPDPPEDPYSHTGEPGRFHTLAVNNAVGAGIACGPNLRPAEKKVIWEHTAEHGPCLGAGADHLYLGWRTDDPALNVAKVQHTATLGVDGVEGLADGARLEQFSDASPALATLGSRLLLAWRGSGNPQLNMAVALADGHTLKAVNAFGDSSDFGPALTVHNGTVFIAWTGRGGNNVNVAKVAFTPEALPVLVDKVVLNASSDASPALGSTGRHLYLAWRGSGNTQLNAAYSEDDGRTFIGTATFGDSSEYGPALTNHAGSLFMAWTGQGNNKVNVAKVLLLGTTGGTPLRIVLEDKVVVGEFAEAAPALASYKGLLFLAWAGMDNRFLNLRVSRDGAFQRPGPWIFSDCTPLGFFIAAYRTPTTVSATGDDFDTGGEWNIRPLENLAIVYAMETRTSSGEVTFDEFRQRTKELNSSLPASLQYGGTYEFRTPDGKRFSCWFTSTGGKYQARILDLNEANPTRDLSTLPLVSGPYMTSPGRHDGLIELRHPGCHSPVILDFRTATNPVRTDNMPACPLPWIDRTRALVTLTQALDAQGRTKDAAAARADAARLYEELTTINPAGNGPALAPAIVQALAGIGVDFSVPEADLRDWLANPQFTPYPALAQALMLTGWRLAAPVHLDVISWKYEHTPGTSSPRTATDVRPDVLQAAILASSNERYGTAVTDFTHLLKP